MVRSTKRMNSGMSFVLASSCKRRTTNIMSTVERSGLKPRVSSGRMLFPFAEVAVAPHDDFEEYFAGMHDKGNATIVTTLRPVFLFVQHLDRCILPLLRHDPLPPHSDDDLIEASQEGVRVCQDLQEFS